MFQVIIFIILKIINSNYTFSANHFHGSQIYRVEEFVIKFSVDSNFFAVQKNFPGIIQIVF